MDYVRFFNVERFRVFEIFEVVMVFLIFWSYKKNLDMVLIFNNFLCLIYVYVY